MEDGAVHEINPVDGRRRVARTGVQLGYAGILDAAIATFVADVPDRYEPVVLALCMIAVVAVANWIEDRFGIPASIFTKYKLADPA